MKSRLVLIIFTIFLLGCEKEELRVLKGDFLYMADAAVLQTPNEVYAVIINKKMHELNDMVQVYKNEDTDMIPVEIRGIIRPLPDGEEGWPFNVEIKEIISVSQPDADNSDVIKIEN